MDVEPLSFAFCLKKANKETDYKFETILTLKIDRILNSEVRILNRGVLATHIKLVFVIFSLSALYNGVQLGKVYSSTDCFCKARFDTIYCPDELARKGVVVSDSGVSQNQENSVVINGALFNQTFLIYNALIGSLNRF